MSNLRHLAMVAGVSLLAIVMWAGPAEGQERRSDRADSAKAEKPRREQPEEEALPEPYPIPPQYYRDFGFPDPDRPWGRGRYLDPDRRGSRRRVPGGYYRPGYGYSYGRYYYDDYTYRFGVPYRDDPYSDDLQRAYRQGVSDGQNYERFEIQAERGFVSYQRAMLDGHGDFAAGDYSVAARHFLLASTLNQGDPASRLCGAHALFALGQYESAAGLLRRAFDLQPKIAYLPMDIRTAYGNPMDFAQQLRALKEALKKDCDRADYWFLLGYALYFTDDMAGAAEAFTNASRLSPDDRIYARLAELAKISAPVRKQTPPKKKSQPSGSGI